jgi:hypothetical protein
LFSGIIINAYEIEENNECILKLPEYEIMANLTEIYGIPPLGSYLKTNFSGIIGIFNVENNIDYAGWCINYHISLPFDNMTITVKLFSSYCSPEHMISLIL